MQYCLINLQLNKTEEVLSHKYKLEQECIFTNKGTSGVRSNDGKKCKIIRLKPASECPTYEPGYAIIFEDGKTLGVRECELKPIN